MTSEQEKVLLDVLCWNAHIFQVLNQYATSDSAWPDSWVEITDACWKQNVSMIQMLIPCQLPDSIGPADYERSVPPRHVAQIQALEYLFQNSPDEFGL